MKKLMLTSASFTTPELKAEFKKLSGKPFPELKVIFIPTASRYEDELKWARLSREKLIEFGIKPENILDFDPSQKLSYEDVKDYDIIYVCGGNTFYLMAKINESGFGKVIKKLVNAGKLYVGVSAGSLIAGPDIESAFPADKNDVELKDFTGLGLTNTIVYVHYTEEEKKIVEELKKKYKYPIVTLTNYQALVITDKKEVVIG